MQIKPNKSWGLLGVGVLLGASAAYAAADPRYNTAVEGIDRATTMLTAIGTGTEKPGAVFQRKRALKALERAKLRIACAKEIEDSTSKKRGCPAAMKDRFDDNDDDRDDDHDHDRGRGHGHDHDQKKEKEKA
jgi:ABC-type Zn2+ transport system substrate-binding protein/surface adhesin